MSVEQSRRVPPVRTEQIILFRCSNQIFAISSASVQEVRSVDSLAGAASVSAAIFRPSRAINGIPSRPVLQCRTRGLFARQLASTAQEKHDELLGCYGDV